MCDSRLPNKNRQLHRTGKGSRLRRTEAFRRRKELEASTAGVKTITVSVHQDHSISCCHQADSYRSISAINKQKKFDSKLQQFGRQNHHYDANEQFQTGAHLFHVATHRNEVLPEKELLTPINDVGYILHSPPTEVNDLAALYFNFYAIQSRFTEDFLLRLEPSPQIGILNELLRRANYKLSNLQFMSQYIDNVNSRLVEWIQNGELPDFAFPSYAEQCEEVIATEVIAEIPVAEYLRPVYTQYSLSWSDEIERDEGFHDSSEVHVESTEVLVADQCFPSPAVIPTIGRAEEHTVICVALESALIRRVGTPSYIPSPFISSGYSSKFKDRDWKEVKLEIRLSLTRQLTASVTMMLLLRGLVKMKDSSSGDWIFSIQFA